MAGKAKLSKYFLDTNVAHNISSLTECNIRDASALKEPWLNTFILKDVFIAPVPESKKACHFNFLLTVEDRAIYRATSRGTLNGRFIGIRPTCKTTEYTAIGIARFSRGR
jgi:hypothetical protein